MTEMSSNYGYGAAKGLRGTRLVLAGSTYNNRAWLGSMNGTYNAKTKTWSLPMPSNNAAASDLLYQIVKRGMQWAAK